jgi:hypothetical protein
MQMKYQSFSLTSTSLKALKEAFLTGLIREILDNSPILIANVFVAESEVPADIQREVMVRHISRPIILITSEKNPLNYEGSEWDWFGNENNNPSDTLREVWEWVDKIASDHLSEWKKEFKKHRGDGLINGFTNGRVETGYEMNGIGVRTKSPNPSQILISLNHVYLGEKLDK